MSTFSSRAEYNDSRKRGVMTSSPISQHSSKSNCDLELRGRTMDKDFTRIESGMSAGLKTNDNIDFEFKKGASERNQSFSIPPWNSTSNHPGGDSCVHYQSIYQPHSLSRCWTISDFNQAIQVPSVMKDSFALEFPDASPPVTFRLKVNKNGILALKPFVTKTFAEDINDFKQKFFKVGISVGPHKVFGVDFAVESPVFQAKKLPKLNLEILEANRLLESYLVDGGLNLIVRYTSLTPVTSPVKSPLMFHRVPSEYTINCCSDFVIRSPSNDCKSELPTTEQQGGCNQLRESSFFRKSFPLDTSKSHCSKTSHKFRKSEASVRSSKHAVRSTSNISSSSLAAADLSCSSNNSNHSDIGTPRGKSCSAISCFDEDESHFHCNQTKRSIPRALSTSKVMVESKDMMALDWDVSTVQFSPRKDNHY